MVDKMDENSVIPPPPPPLIDNWQFIIKNRSPPFHLIINTYNKIHNS